MTTIAKGIADRIARMIVSLIGQTRSGFWLLLVEQVLHRVSEPTHVLALRAQLSPLAAWWCANTQVRLSSMEPPFAHGLHGFGSQSAQGVVVFLAEMVRAVVVTELVDD